MRTKKIATCKICKSSNKVYCIVDPNSNKIYRATFSKSLAEWIVEKYHPEMEVRRLEYKLGKILKPGEKSRALYAIRSYKGITLRASMSSEHATMLTECDSRYMQELFLVTNNYCGVEQSGSSSGS